MRCPYCGRENDENRVICSECLKPLRKEKNGKKIAVLAAAAAVLIAGIVTVAILITGPGRDKKTEEPDNPAPAAVETVPAVAETVPDDNEPVPAGEPLVEDLDRYFMERGQLTAKIKADESETVHTGAEIVTGMKERGITQYPVTSEYAMDGAFSEEADVSADAGVKHPMYTTYYVASNGDIWTINDVNGCLTAYPVTYHVNSEPQIQVVFSETEKIMSYDSTTNCFYETIPDPSVLVVKIVERIDAETLDRISTEGIDRQ